MKSWWYCILLDRLTVGIVAFNATGRGSWTSYVSFSNATVSNQHLRNSLLTATGGRPCLPTCTVSNPALIYTWIQVPPLTTTTIIAATVVKIVDKQAGTTRAVTSHVNEPPLISGTAKNSGTVEILSYGRTVTTVLVYPTDFTYYPTEYYWWGTLLTTDLANHAACSTADYSNPATVPLYASGTPAQGPPAEIDKDDPRGLSYILATENQQPFKRLTSFDDPAAAFEYCEDFWESPAIAVDTTEYLTVTSSSTVSELEITESRVRPVHKPPRMTTTTTGARQSTRSNNADSITGKKPPSSVTVAPSSRHLAISTAGLTMYIVTRGDVVVLDSGLSISQTNGISSGLQVAFSVFVSVPGKNSKNPKMSEVVGVFTGMLSADRVAADRTAADRAVPYTLSLSRVSITRSIDTTISLAGFLVSGKATTRITGSMATRSSVPVGQSHHGGSVPVPITATTTGNESSVSERRWPRTSNATTTNILTMSNLAVRRTKDSMATSLVGLLACAAWFLYV